MPSTPSPRDAGERPTLSTALEATIDRFRRMIVAIGRRHGLPEADVDEVVQEVRIRLWRARSEPATLAGLGSSYVHRTAVSAALDILRRRRAARTGVDVTAPLPPTLALVRDDPSQAAEARELAEQVHACVERLLPTRRPVVRMYLAGYDRREIAQVLHWSEGRVRNLLSRGLADLRALLNERGIGLERSGERA